MVSDCEFVKAEMMTQTCRTRVKITHLTTNRVMTSGMNLMICSNRFSFKVDMELLECRQVHDLSYFGGSEVLFVRIVHPADEAMIGNQFTRTQPNDIGCKRTILHAADERFGLEKLGSTIRIWRESVRARNAASTKTSRRIKDRCLK